MSQATLDQQLENAFNELQISSEQRDSLNTYLGLVRNRDKETYEHSARVGLKGIEVARFTHVVQQKALFYAGLLHDSGKALTDPKSLKKTEGFNEKDMKELRKHPIDGYRLLKGIHDFSARILLYHHWFSESGYPKKIPGSDINFSKGSEVNIMYYSRLLSLVDFYDAVTHRENDKFSPGKPRLPTSKEAKTLLLQANRDQIYLIKELYKYGIF